MSQEVKACFQVHTCDGLSLKFLSILFSAPTPLIFFFFVIDFFKSRKFTKKKKNIKLMICMTDIYLTE